MSLTCTKTTPATNALAMFALKEALVDEGWIVVSSSDGSTYNAAGDQITTGASGAGGLDNSDAWFRLRMPEYQGRERELMVQRGGSGQSWRIAYSHEDTFDSGTPDATTIPEATDQEFVL